MIKFRTVMTQSRPLYEKKCSRIWLFKGCMDKADVINALTPTLYILEMAGALNVSLSLKIGFY